jgi:hypothetical protein
VERRLLLDNSGLAYVWPGANVSLDYIYSFYYHLVIPWKDVLDFTALTFIFPSYDLNGVLSPELH